MGHNDSPMPMRNVQDLIVEALDSYVPYAVGGAMLIVVAILAQWLELTWLEKALLILVSALLAFFASAALVSLQRAKAEDEARVRRENEERELEKLKPQIYQDALQKALRGDDKKPSIAAEPRIFVTETLDGVLAVPSDSTGVQIQKSKSVYVGKWMRVTGALESLMFFDTFYQVTFKKRNAYFYFQPSWAERLEHLKPGQELTLIGQVKEIDQTACLHLKMCELESVVSPVPETKDHQFAENKAADVVRSLERLSPILTPPPKGASQEAIKAGLRLRVWLVPNTGGTPGLSVKAINDGPEAVTKVSIMVVNIRVWDNELEKFITLPEIHGSSPEFPEAIMLSGGTQTLHPKAPVDYGLIRLEGNKVEFNGHPRNYQSAREGIWEMKFRIGRSETNYITDRVWFDWHRSDDHNPPWYQVCEHPPRSPFVVD